MKKGVISITGIFLLAMAVFFVQSLNMATFNMQGIPGPGFTPKLYLSIGFLAAVVVIFNTIRSKEKDVKVGTNRLVFKMGLLTMLYIFLIPVLGYLLSTLIAFLTIYRVLGVKGWKFTLALSGGFLAVIYLIFSKFLLVPIPKGMLF